MKKKVKIDLLIDKYKQDFFFISIYGKYNYKQYILRNNLLYTFFLIINFLYKYGFIKIKKK
ncbi:MAG TPA: hypothetical protein VN854_00365 [Mycoplasmatales bacterium]|nr:hypothetical protein [Mycoplasmatales bacterium]